MDLTKQPNLPNKKRIINVLEIIAVCILGLLAWKLNNRFYSIFIVLIFIGTLLLEFRKSIFFLIVFSFLFIIFNTLILDNLLIFKRVNVPFLQHPKSAYITLFSPNSGQDVFPPEVQNMSFLLQKNGIYSYQISEEFENDIEIYHRIVGAAWPKKMEKSSPYILISSNTIQNFLDCKIIDQKENITLVDCR